MRFNSLASRIVLLFLVLILAVQVAGFIVIRQSINDNAREAISKQLLVGERVFRRQLDQSAEKFATSAHILAKDTGFGEAIGTNEKSVGLRYMWGLDCVVLKNYRTK